MSDRPAAPRRTGAFGRRRALAILLGLGVGTILLVALIGPAPLVATIVRSALDRMGVAVDRLEVTGLGLGHVAFGPLGLGGAGGPTMTALTATWSVSSLWHRRIDSLRMNGLQLRATSTPAGFAIDGLTPSPGASGATSSAPVVALPCDSLEIADSTLDLSLPAGRIHVELDAGMTRQADSSMLGRARLKAVATTGSATGASIEAELPHLILGAPGQALRLDIEGGRLTSPGLPGALGVTTATLTIAADRIDLSATATGEDGATGGLALTGMMSRGGAPTSSSLAVTLKGFGIPGALVKLSGIEGRVRLVSLTPPRTAAPQTITGSLQLPPLTPGRFTLTAVLPGDASLRLEAARIDIDAGSVSLPPVTLAAGRPVATVLGLDGVDLGILLPLLGIDGLGGTGILDGHLPVRIDPAGVAISGGRLVARGPGVLHYTGAALPAALPGSAATTVGLLRQALADFHYTGLSLDLDRAVSGQGSLAIGLKGANPAVLNGYPFVLNIRVEADFDRLAGLLRVGYDAAGGLLRRGIGR